MEAMFSKDTEDLFLDLFMHRFDRIFGADDHALKPLGLLPGDPVITPADFAVKEQALSFHSVRLFVRDRALQTLFERQIQKKRERRLYPLRRLFPESAYPGDVDACAESLIRHRRIHPAVAKHDLASLQARRDDFRHKLGPAGHIKQSLGHSGHTFILVVEQDIAYRVAEPGSARLTRQEYTLLFLQKSIKKLGLRGLAAAFVALEGDQYAFSHTSSGVATGPVTASKPSVLPLPLRSAQIVPTPRHPSPKMLRFF